MKQPNFYAAVSRTAIVDNCLIITLINVNYQIIANIFQIWL